MEQLFLGVFDYLIDVFSSTFSQLFILLGPLLILAFLMNFVARKSEKLSYKLLGRNGYLYGFGWLGTSVHEIGHAIFALLFGHKINEIALFTPKNNDGSLGHVHHSYRKDSIYQNIGNFFIGIGPILFGSIVLYLVTYLLFRFSALEVCSAEFTSDSLMSISAFTETLIHLLSSALNYFDYVFTSPNSSWWKIVILIYILFSVGSSITLSTSDIKGSLSGFLFFIGVLLFFNLVTLWIGDFTINLFAITSSFFSGFYFLIILSLLINIVFMLIMLLMLALKSAIVRQH